MLFAYHILTNKFDLVISMMAPHDIFEIHRVLKKMGFLYLKLMVKEINTNLKFSSGMMWMA